MISTTTAVGGAFGAIESNCPSSSKSSRSLQELHDKGAEGVHTLDGTEYRVSLMLLQLLRLIKVSGATGNSGLGRSSWNFFIWFWHPTVSWIRSSPCTIESIRLSVGFEISSKLSFEHIRYAVLFVGSGAPPPYPGGGSWDYSQPPPSAPRYFVPTQQPKGPPTPGTTPDGAGPLWPSLGHHPPPPTTPSSQLPPQPPHNAYSWLPLVSFVCSNRMVRAF